ncbi:MAG TPA: hypothetical protein VKH64_00940 [Candidatus Binatia bacterium]|nr:hypothetical protein [Candidatus Binatia bacterium]
MIAMLTMPALRATLGRGGADAAPEGGVVDIRILKRWAAAESTVGVVYRFSPALESGI